jgi:succinoglycan biosynthesis transport protein ExoP
MKPIAPLYRREQALTAVPSNSPELEEMSAFRPSRSQPHANLLMEYLRTILRWRTVILCCALMGGLLSLLFNLDVLPLYQARTSLDIQSINGDFMNMRSVAPTGDNAAFSNESYVQTQIKLLQSTTLLDRTVDHLKSDPHPVSLDRQDLVSKVKRSLHLSSGRDLAYNDLVDDTAKRVKVKPLGITRLVEVTCDSWDAEFAAKFCNALTEQFREVDLETRGIEAQKTSEWLTRQVADVRQKAEDSQRKLEAATGGDGLALSQSSNSIGEDRLRQLQGELVRAQAERMERESQSRIATSASADALPASIESAAYRDYKQKLADLNARVAELVPPLTEDNPKVIHLRSEISEVRQGMTQERATTTDRMRNEFESSRRHEDLLNAAYATLQSSVSNEMSKAARVNLLRREVESEQNLYQTLLQRAKEAGFASAMQATTIRVVDRGIPPKVPISPRRGVAAGVGLVLGSFGGLAFAFFRDRHANVFRVPGEAERHLHVHELGVIPSAGSARRGSAPPVLRSTALSNGTVLEGQIVPALSCWNETFSIVAEAYRNATHSILLAGVARRRSRVYVVTSPNAGEGKTTVTTNLGVALSKSKLRVVVIDGDLRKPGLHKNLMVENNFGLRNLLREEVSVSTAPLDHLCKQTVVPNLFMIPSGTGREEVVELLHTGSAITRLLDRLALEFDVVLIDTPPMLHMADARILAAQSDGVILVLRAGLTSRDQAANACDLFENDQVPLVGTILNDFNPAREGRSGYYQSYYRYKDEIEAAEAAGVGL